MACSAAAAAFWAAAHDGTPHAKPIASKAAQTAQAKSLPARRSGLWEITLHSDEVTLRRAGQASPRPVTVQQCTSAQTEPVMLLSLLPGQESCGNTRVRRVQGSDGAGFDISNTCKVHGVRNDAQVTLRGDLQSHYSGTFQVRFASAAIKNTGTKSFEGRWLGACKEGQRPGDMVLPNGVTVNVVDDRRRAEAHGHEGHDHGPGHKH